MEFNSIIIWWFYNRKSYGWRTLRVLGTHTHARTHTHAHTHIYIYIYIYICVCISVYVCLCVIHIYIYKSKEKIRHIHKHIILLIWLFFSHQRHLFGFQWRSSFSLSLQVFRTVSILANLNDIFVWMVSTFPHILNLLVTLPILYGLFQV